MSASSLDARGVVTACPHCGTKNRLAYDRLTEDSRCGNCKTALSPPSSPVEVGDAADFQAAVAHASVPIVVDYWAPWCGPCRMVAPELEKVAARLAGRVLVLKVNTDALPDVGEQQGVRSIPTMAVFAAGREVARTVGARPAADILAFVEGSTSSAPR
jgi:thioredoxin 2